MNRAQQLVRKLVEAGPDDLNPKGEVLRLPPDIWFADPEYKDDPDEGWRYELAEQLNRLNELVSQLSREGRKTEASDLDELIRRVADFEEIKQTQQVR